MGTLYPQHEAALAVPPLPPGSRFGGIFADEWNEVWRRLESVRPLRISVREEGEWRHPWFTTPAWDPERSRWEVTVRPGFVNDDETTFEMPAAEAPGATLERLGVGGDHGEPVQAWLSEGPRIPITQFRTVGAGSRTGEGAPEFFHALGAGDPLPVAELLDPSGGPIDIDDIDLPTEDNRKLRKLVAGEIVVRKDRLGNTSQWNAGTLGGFTLAQFTIQTKRDPGAQPQARIFAQSGAFENPEEPDRLQFFRGEVEGRTWDDCHIATLWLLAPEDLGSDEGVNERWQPFVQHRTFWNLSHDINLLDPPPEPQNVRFMLGLAGGVSDRSIAGMVADINDTIAAARNFVDAHRVQGIFWTI